MAVLNDTARIDVWMELMRRYSADGETIAINKADLRAAVDAIDAFLNTNTTAINNAFPTAARNGLTTPQKALILMYVTQKRWVEGS